MKISEAVRARTLKPERIDLQECLNSYERDLLLPKLTNVALDSRNLEAITDPCLTLKPLAALAAERLSGR